jgi:hypothetical protein
MIPFDEPGMEEELEPGKRNRLRFDLIVAAGALLVVGLVARSIAGGDDGSGPAASRSPTPSRASGPTPVAGPGSVFVTGADGQRSRVPDLPRRVAADPAACPPLQSCSTETAGPGLMLQPVLSRFSGARVVAVKSVRLQDEPWTGSLWYRQLRFEVNGGELDVRIVARNPDERPDSGRVGDRLFVRETRQRYEVTVQALGATGVTLDDLRRIATDDRLLTT